MLQESRPNRRVVQQLGLSCLVFFSLLLVPAHAQFSGSIEGNVTDPSGAEIANASITLVNTATNVSQKTTSGTDGNYRFVSLAPGSYKISGTGSGFQTTNTTITLTTGQNLNVPIGLQVAGTSTSVEVTAGPLFSIRRRPETKKRFSKRS